MAGKSLTLTAFLLSVCLEYGFGFICIVTQLILTELINLRK